jgi:hypothetical protein
MTANSTTKSPAKSGTVSTVPVTGTVIPRDAVVFARPTNAGQRTQMGADNVSALRSMLSTLDSTLAGILSRLVLALVLNPTTKTDDNGKVIDALTALTSGDGALPIPRSEVSKARAAFRLVQAAGIGSTADPRWQAVLQVTGRAGVGADRVDAALKGAKGKRETVKALESIASAKGDDKAALIRDTFGKGRSTDKSDAGTKAWQAAARGVKVIEEAIAVAADKGGMTADERTALAGLLAGIAKGLK